MPIKKRGLGRGLDALFDENSGENNGSVKIPINDIEPNRDQPRKDFDDDALNELAESITTHGLIQPIVVKPMSNGRYSIVAGERRWRASRIAGLDEVPAVIMNGDGKTLMEVALIENLQREDLNAVEEALGYRSLIDSFGLTQEEVAKRMGKSRTAVTNSLRLLSLKPEELDALRKGIITAGHARALLSCDDAEKRKRMLIAAADGASVRELERMAAKPTEKTEKEKKVKSNFFSEVELALKEELHRKVKIHSTGKGKGTITLEFYNDRELADFARRLAGEK